jgi:hypothetical protein
MSRRTASGPGRAVFLTTPTFRLSFGVSALEMRRSKRAESKRDEVKD